MWGWRDAAWKQRLGIKEILLILSSSGSNTDPCAEALTYINISIQIPSEQARAGRGFAFEHPDTATSWATLALKQAWQQIQGSQLARFDHCRFGLTSPRGEPMKKATKLWTNMPGVFRRFLYPEALPDYRSMSHTNGR